MCVCVYMSLRMPVPLEAREAIGSCRNRVTGDYEAPDIESENQTPVFSRSNKHP